jgi:DNA transformation protein
LESLLAGLHWRDIAKNHRTSLLLALDDAEKNSQFDILKSGSI